MRMDRIWLATTLLLALLLAGVLWQRADRGMTLLVARWSGACAYTLERVAALAPASVLKRGPARLVARGKASALRAWLAPGHYVLRLRGASDEALIKIPFLVLRGEQELTWSLEGDLPEGFVPVPAGPFLRTPRGTVDRTGRLILAARHEVTRAEYARFLEALAAEGVGSDGFHAACSRTERETWPDGCPGHGRADALGLEGHPERKRWPVADVSWYDALAFARWTSMRAGGRWSFRLPTAREWQKLACGSDGRRFPWGNDSLDERFRERRDVSPVPVDTRPHRASPWGILHLAGNVAEWTADVGDESGLTRITEGRSWSSAADRVRAAGFGDPATRRAPDLGFRLVAEPLGAADGER